MKIASQMTAFTKYFYKIVPAIGLLTVFISYFLPVYTKTDIIYPPPYTPIKTLIL